MIALITVFTAASCDLFNSDIGVTGMGKMLVPDEAGYFKEDITYSLSGAIQVFYADGNYLYENYEWDPVSLEYVRDEGESGTYSWNPETMVMTQKQLKNYVQATDTWEDISETSERTMYFTTVCFGNAFVYSENNSWESSTLVEYNDGSYDTDSYQMTLDSETYILKREDLSYDNNGVLTSGWNSERNCEVSGMFPEGVAWESGNRVIFNLTETLDRDRNYDSISSSWGAWDINDLDIYQMIFLNMGNFFCIPNPSAMRGTGEVIYEKLYD